MRSASEFSQTIRGGRRSGNKYLVVYAVPGSNHIMAADLPKVGFVVSKAVGNSVVRHHVVRRMRHCMREFLPQCYATYIVVRALPPIAHIDSSVMFAALNRELTRLHVIETLDDKKNDSSLP